MAFRLKKNKYNILWPICILKYTLPMISSTFFGQIFVLLLSAFKCPTGRLYYSSNASCIIDTWYYVSFPIVIIAIIIQIFLSYMTLSMHYQVDFINEGNDIIKKRNSTQEIFFLLNKIILIIIFGFDKEKENEHWGIIFVICLLTGLNAYITFFIQNYENIIIKKLNFILGFFVFTYRKNF